MNVVDTVIQIIAEHEGLKVSDLTPDRTLEDLGVNSLDAIDIIYEVEQRFDVEVPQEIDVDRVKTVRDVVELVNSLVGARENGAAGPPVAD